MLGSSPIAAIPFSSLADGINFEGAVADAAVGSDFVSEQTIYANSIVESVVPVDTVEVIASVFSVLVQELLNASETAEAASVFISNAVEAAQILETATVAPSTFGASVSEEARVAEQFFAAVAFIAGIQEGVQVADQLLARLLWELVNTQQTANWAAVQTT
jgi:hypothetical protein